MVVLWIVYISCVSDCITLRKAQFPELQADASSQGKRCDDVTRTFQIIPVHVFVLVYADELSVPMKLVLWERLRVQDELEYYLGC